MSTTTDKLAGDDQQDNLADDDQLVKARSFFAEQQLDLAGAGGLVANAGGGGANALRAPAAAEANRSVGAPRTKAPDSQLTYLIVESDVDDDAKSELKAQKQYLIDLMGVATAWVQKQADIADDPNVMWDANKWAKVYTKLPMFSAPRFKREQGTKRVQGVEIATKFLATLTGMLVAGPEIGPFVQFLQGMQDDIKASNTTGTKNFNFGALSATLLSQRVAGQPFIEGYLKGTFIVFNKSEQIIKTTCGSAMDFSFDVDVKVASMLFNYGALRAGSEVKTKFDAFLRGTQVAAIEDASSFFNFKSAKEDVDPEVKDFFK